MASTEVAWTLPEGTRPIDAIGQAQAFRKSAPLGLGWGARTFSSRHRSECIEKELHFTGLSVTKPRPRPGNFAGATPLISTP